MNAPQKKRLRQLLAVHEAELAQRQQNLKKTHIQLAKVQTQVLAPALLRLQEEVVLQGLACCVLQEPDAGLQVTLGGQNFLFLLRINPTTYGTTLSYLSGSEHAGQMVDSGEGGPTTPLGKVTEEAICAAFLQEFERWLRDQLPQ